MRQNQILGMTVGAELLIEMAALAVRLERLGFQRVRELPVERVCESIQILSFVAFLTEISLVAGCARLFPIEGQESVPHEISVDVIEVNPVAGRLEPFVPHVTREARIAHHPVVVAILTGDH
jgi:hypothetical protein